MPFHMSHWISLFNVCHCIWWRVGPWSLNFCQRVVFMCDWNLRWGNCKTCTVFRGCLLPCESRAMHVVARAHGAELDCCRRIAATAEAGAMPTRSSSRCALPWCDPFTPLIAWEDCGVVVKRLTSHTPAHDGGVFFKCDKHATGHLFFENHFFYSEWVSD
jgi:hypothetical protein